MTPAEVRAKADELRVKLQALSGVEIGWGMDRHVRKVLQAAYDMVGMVDDLAQCVEKLSTDIAAKSSSESNP